MKRLPVTKALAEAIKYCNSSSVRRIYSDRRKDQQRYKTRSSFLPETAMKIVKRLNTKHSNVATWELIPSLYISYQGKHETGRFRIVARVSHSKRP